jgi:ActR/RegA family two-component response regulator
MIERVVATTMAPGQKALGAMLQKERWEEIRRRYFEERKGIAEIARGLDMDRKRSVAVCVMCSGNRMGVRAAGRRS